MFALALDRDPPSSSATEALRARIQQNRISREEAKLARAEAIVQSQREVLDKLSDPLSVVDQDIMAIPTLALPGKSGEAASFKVVSNPATKGKDLSEVVAEHSLPMTTDQVARAKPWSSYKRSTWSIKTRFGQEPYSVPCLVPSFRSTRFLEEDERCPDDHTAGPKRKRRHVDQDGTVTVNQSPPPSNFCAMTQDEFEEYDPLEDHWMNES